jgi:hypothetical protein
MTRSLRTLVIFGLGTLALLAIVSLAWGARHALLKSDDLVRRAEEVALFLERHDPYIDPDMTYPPTALPIFSALIAPLPRAALKPAWLLLNLLALGVLLRTSLQLWCQRWPAVVQAVAALTVLASKPVRLGIGLGQFHLIPLALTVLALRIEQPLVAGICLSIALAKPTMVVPLLVYFAIAGRWRTLIVAAACQVLALLGVSQWLGVAPRTLLAEWVGRARGQEGAGLIDVPSLLHSIISHASALAIPAAVVLVILTVALAFMFRRASQLAVFSFCAFMSAIFTYHRPYDLVLLIPAYLLAVESAISSAGRWTGVKTAVAVFFGLALVVPGDPFVKWGYEREYDAAFIVLAYGFLAATLIALVASDAANRRSADDSANR